MSSGPKKLIHELEDKSKISFFELMRDNPNVIAVYWYGEIIIIESDEESVKY